MSGEMHVIGTAALLRALPATQLAVIENLLRTKPIVSTEEAVDALWGHDPEGGPDSALEGVRRNISTLRRRGLPIRAHRGRGYWLETA